MTQIEVLEHFRNQLKTKFNAVWIKSTGPARAIYPCVTIYAASEQNYPYTIHQAATLVTVYITVWIKEQRSDERTEYDLADLAALVRSSITCPPGALEFEWLTTDPEIDEEEPEIHSSVLTCQVVYLRN